MGHSVGIDVHGDPYHFGVIQKPLTRNLAARFDDLADEIATAFSELVPVKVSNGQFSQSSSENGVLKGLLQRLGQGIST